MSGRRSLSAFLGILAVVLALAGGSARAGPKEWGHHEVGHAVIHLSLTGSAGEPRPLDVMLWYPADRRSYNNEVPSSYTSRLNGVTLVPGQWDPLSWEVASEVARDDATVSREGRAFPLIILSHGAGAQPQNHAGLAERLASHGFIVAGPSHNGDTEDETGIDYVNGLAGTTILPCFDGMPGPCRDPVMKSVRDRAFDVSAIIDNMAAYFGDRVDLTRIGLLGQSRGSVTGLAAAGGSTAWGIAPEPRVRALVMLTTGVEAVVFSQNLAAVTVPYIQVTGTLDAGGGVAYDAVAKKAFPVTSSATKFLLVLKGVDHFVHSDRRCAMTQAMGAIAQSNPKAILEVRSTRDLLISSFGTAPDWCFYDTFTDPVDITSYVQSITGILVTPYNVPMRLDSETVLGVNVDLTLNFFGDVLGVEDDDGDDDGENRPVGSIFGRYLGTKFQQRYGDLIDSVEAYPCLGKACVPDYDD